MSVTPSPPPGLDSFQLAQWYQQHPTVQPPAASPSPSPTVGSGAAGILGTIGNQAAVGAQSAAPAGGELALIQALQGVGATKKGNTSQETLLGVGTTGTQKVDTTGLGSLAGAGTITDAVNAFDKLWQTDDSTFTYLQQQLQAAGFYTDSTQQPTFGVYSAADQGAFVNAVKAAAQSGSNLQQYLSTRAAVGLTNGIKALPSDVTVITHANQTNTDAALETVAKSLTGSDATLSPDLLTRFHAVYDAAYVAGQKQAVKEQTAAAANANSAVANGVTDALSRQSSGADSQTPQGWAQNPFGQVLAAGQASEDAATLRNAASGATPALGLTADVTQAPDISAAAAQFLQQQDAPDVKAQQNSQVTKSLLSILAGNGS